MQTNQGHSFHIPVMGLAFTIDTPLKVARYGISSAVSIIDDLLLEAMRKLHAPMAGEVFEPIPSTDPDCRARRITAYLNLLNRIVHHQMDVLSHTAFEPGSEIEKYFQLLPADTPLKQAYQEMQALPEGPEKNNLQQQLSAALQPGAIDVNIMTKCDKVNYDKDGAALPAEYSDAMAALRGFAKSDLHSSIIFSAGMNPRLYSYCESFEDFYPNELGTLKKRIILKVSDYRSAYLQGKILAKKGLWVSEYRIESGLNCGGHAFATQGYLMGPILEEFKQNRMELINELFSLCNTALLERGKCAFAQPAPLKITAQGGIGTATENDFLLDHYQLNSTGWGSPFLLVPEATNVDESTLNKLATARPSDYYVSNASPLGVKFNNLRTSSGAAERKTRMEGGRPGSPCYNKYLSFNTEFTKQPICTASREYQDLKIKQIQSSGLDAAACQLAIEKVTEKECICQGLGTAVFLKNHLPTPHKLNAVSICPGPNLAFFSGIFSLADMIDHIYGRKNILNQIPRPGLFINELHLYIDHLKKELQQYQSSLSAKNKNYLLQFRNNLLAGITYYKSITLAMKKETDQYRLLFTEALNSAESTLTHLLLPEIVTPELK